MKLKTLNTFKTYYRLEECSILNVIQRCLHWEVKHPTPDIKAPIVDIAFDDWKLSKQSLSKGRETKLLQLINNEVFVLSVFEEYSKELFDFLCKELGVKDE